MRTFPRLRRPASLASALLATALLAGVFAPARPSAGHDEPVTRPGTRTPPPTPNAAQLQEVRQALRGGRHHEAAAKLRSLDFPSLTKDEQRSYRLLGRDAALRIGDRAWLEELNDVPDRLAFADGYAILTAWSYLKAADFESARFYLGKVRDFAHLNEREKRRYMSIQARIEQFDGTPETERAVVGKLVDYVGRWGTPICQECHDNREKPGELPGLDVANWWGGERFVALLKQAGDADSVRVEAEAKLAADPVDEPARLRLAYALRALGDEPAAQAAFAELPWAAMPGRDLLPPRDIQVFP